MPSLRVDAGLPLGVAAVAALEALVHVDARRQVEAVPGRAQLKISLE